MPTAVADLAARQLGDGVVLTFTLPRKSVDDEPLEETPAVEVYRALLPAGAAPPKLATHLAVTIPAALVDTFVSEGRVRYVDPLAPAELAQHPGEQALYMVRTRGSKGRASADSNVAAVHVYPAPEPISDLRATVTETAIDLSWSPPARTTAGTPLSSLAGYRVYRDEVETGSEAAAGEELPKVKLKTPLTLLAPASSAAFRDTQFEFGRTYLYTVRSVAQYGPDAVESAEARLAIVTPRDVFPPAPPQGLDAVVVPATPESPGHIELSWAISVEGDFAGYNVYRSEKPGTPGERLNGELLLAPTFRDMSVAPGHAYTYRVTAVDRSGNESPPSAAVSAEVPQGTP